MTLKTEFEKMKAYVELKLPDLKLNGELIDMLEGNLYRYVDAMLKSGLAEESYKEAKDRITPINLIQKINDKLATIYNPGPMRVLKGGNNKDQEMFAWYLKNSNIDSGMKTASENYSLCKGALIQPLMHKGKLLVRPLPNDHYVVYSSDRVNPLYPTNVLLIEGDGSSGGFQCTVWSDKEVARFKSDNTEDKEYMAAIGNPEGVNIYETLPFVYVNKSQRKLMPPADLDLKTMVTLLPLLISDLNFAVKFLCFSITYGIDVDDAGLKRAPNAFWALKSDTTTDTKPQIGSIKPEVDIDAVLSLIQSELSLFLNSKGIKPGSIGTLDKDSFASGLSKMVDEMDTVDLRRAMVTEFTRAENDLWNFILHTAHPIWIKAGELNTPMTSPFSKDCYVEVKFAEQLPLVNRGKVISDLKAEVDARFTTRRRAIQIANPTFTEKELDALMKEIEEENGNEVATSGSEDTERPDGLGTGEPS